MCKREDLSGSVQAIEGGIIQTGKWTARIEGIGIPRDLEATWVAVDFRTRQVFTVDSIQRNYDGNRRLFSVLCFDSDIAFSLFDERLTRFFGVSKDRVIGPEDFEAARRALGDRGSFPQFGENSYLWFAEAVEEGYPEGLYLRPNQVNQVEQFERQQDVVKFDDIDWIVGITYRKIEPQRSPILITLENES